MKKEYPMLKLHSEYSFITGTIIIYYTNENYLNDKIFLEFARKQVEKYLDFDTTIFTHIYT
jgi:hypothetical protein